MACSRAVRGVPIMSAITSLPGGGGIDRGKDRLRFADLHEIAAIAIVRYAFDPSEGDEGAYDVAGDTGLHERFPPAPCGTL